MRPVRVVFNFTPSTEPVHRDSVTELVVSWLHACLGNNNPYHGKPSQYSVSNLNGSVTENGFCTYPNGANIIVSSPDIDFISQLCMGLGNKKDLGYGMTYESMSMGNIKTNQEFDKIQTLSPILLQHNNHHKVTVNDDNFIEVLTASCIKKLSPYFSEDKLKTFRIEIFKKENAKVQVVKYKKNKNISSYVRLKIFGLPEVRETLYALGLGKSTGNTFGAIKVIS